jgi:hypothetical protein
LGDRDPAGTSRDDPAILQAHVARYRNGCVRLLYATAHGAIERLKDGILLEVGFDHVAPNTPRDHPGYTLVEKLQAISTKFRQEQATGVFPPNVMRHRYDGQPAFEDLLARTTAWAPGL